MSIRDTKKLNRLDLRYLLIDSLKLYSDNVGFIGGSNPYKFSINNKVFYVYIKNVHESGEGRGNQDECRIQVSKSKNFNEVINSNKYAIVLGYFADHNVFTAWNPFVTKERFNQRQTISLYSRFSTQEKASLNRVSLYTDNNQQNIISFKPEYLGLYLDNIDSVHLLSENKLLEIVNLSDDLNIKDEVGSVLLDDINFTISHQRTSRDPNFRKIVNHAYKSRCAMCGIQLGLVEAAHIIPHTHDAGTDDISNGICLCRLHHGAYDRGLIYFNSDFKILFNEDKLKYLSKMGLDSGFYQFQNITFNDIQLPENLSHYPSSVNINKANHLRGVLD
jgi:putative restriction endonuclease